MLITLMRQIAGLILLFLFMAGDLSAQAADGLRPMRGFRVERVVGGSHLAGAQDFAWDPAGQVWVLVKGERLLVLDARVDGQRVFAEGLQQASAFVLSGSGVLLADADGIQRMESAGEPGTPMLGGLAGSGLHVSALAWALDGSVVGALAGEGVWLVGEGVALEAGVFRFRSDGSDVEQLAHVPSGVLSVEPSWDGELFFSAQDQTASHLLVPERALGRALQAWSPLARRPSDALYAYAGGVWPAEFENALIVCDRAAGRLKLYGVLPKGNGFRLLDAGPIPFLSSTDSKFRPVALGGGPGGALYVLDARADEGTLWRMQHSSRSAKPQPPIPSLDPRRPAALLPELASPNAWRRLSVQRMLLEHGLDEESLDKLAKLARQSQSPMIQLHALWMGAGGAPYHSWCLSNYAASVRRNALALAEDRFAGARRRIPSGSILSLMHDADARVRLQALQAWRVCLGPGQAVDLVRLYPKLNSELAQSLALAIALKHPVEMQKAIFRQRDSAPYFDWLGAMADHVAAEGSGRDTINLVLGLSAGNETPALQARVLTALHTRGRGREKPWPSPRLSAVLRRMGDSPQLSVALATLPLAYAWAGGQISSSRFAEWTQRAHATLEGRQAQLSLRVAAARALLALPKEREAGIRFAGILLALELSELQQERLFDELGTGEESTAAAVLIRSLGSVGDTARDSARRSIAARSEWTELLLAALEAGNLAGEALGAEWRAELLASPDAKLAARAAQLFR